MIYYNNHEIAAIYHLNRAIAAVYKGTRLVWEYIRSCFGKGWWINNQPWRDTDSWKNN